MVRNLTIASQTDTSQTDTQSLVIDLQRIKEFISPAGYLAIDDILEYYELNYLVDIQEELEIPIEEMSKEQKIKVVLDNDAFIDSTGYYEWSEEEINQAIFKMLKEQADRI